MPDAIGAVSEHDRVSLVELVNRVVDRGVVLGGDITISVADVDLLYLGLRVLLCSPEQFLRDRPSPVPSDAGGTHGQVVS